MTDHLRYAGRPQAEQAAALEEFIRAEPVLMDVLEVARDEGLHEALIVAGAIYNLVWNRMTGRPALDHINDIDLVYFDPDLSWEAEDQVIRRLGARLSHSPVRVEIRNQARVHLWFPAKLGISDFAPLGSAAAMIPFYSAPAFAVGARLETGDAMTIIAPFGLDDLFSFRIVPNPALPNRQNYTQKSARAQAVWPELIVTPWAD